MRLWRISNYPDLTGQGGLLAAARWHSKGRPIVYAAEHPALCLVEMLVHLDYDDLPAGFTLLGIDCPDDAVERLSPLSLPDNWRGTTEITRDLGDRWLSEKRSLLLAVPSVILPHATNVLFNPAHPRAGETLIRSADKVPLDPRLT